MFSHMSKVIGLGCWSFSLVLSKLLETLKQKPSRTRVNGSKNTMLLNAPPSIAESVSDLELRGKKALVIDDFANVRKSIKAMLSELGFGSVLESYDSTSATQAVKENRFSLILCDYNLGKSKDGSRLLEEWRAKKLIDQNTIFVMITADTSREVVINALEFEPDDYLAKPFAMDILASRLHRWFDKRAMLKPIQAAVENADWQAVITLTRNLMDTNPRYRAVSQKYHANALIKLEKFTEAEGFLQALLEKRYQGWVKTELHRVHVFLGKYDDAESGLKSVLLKDPYAMEAYDLLASVYQVQEKDAELQALMEQATSRSPRSISRHQTLAEIAQKNLDFTRSNKAYKDVTTLAEGTMHESLGAYQQLVNGLQVELQSEELGEQRRRDIQKDLNFVSKKINERFQSNINAKLFNSALRIRKDKAIHPSDNHPKLNELFTEMFANLDDIIPETAFYVTETFYFAERYDDGDEVVRRLREKFKENTEFLKKLDELQSEPISLGKRKAAKEVNLRGIECYKKSDYIGSLRYFKQALELSPRHPGMILNYVQSRLQQLRDVDHKVDGLRECAVLLKRLSYLPEDHYQYQRYSKLLTTINNMK